MIENVSSLSDDILYKLTEFYKVFSSSTRIKILYQLLESDSSVGKLAHVLNMSQSTVSHQLKIIKSNRLIKMEKQGKQVIYSIFDPRVKLILRQGIEHIEEIKQVCFV